MKFESSIIFFVIASWLPSCSFDSTFPNFLQETTECEELCGHACPCEIGDNMEIDMHPDLDSDHDLTEDESDLVADPDVELDPRLDPDLNDMDLADDESEESIDDPDADNWDSSDPDVEDQDVFVDPDVDEEIDLADPDINDPIEDPEIEPEPDVLDDPDLIDLEEEDVCIPSVEVCNGRDDNCDNLIDNDTEEAGDLCMTGLYGICSNGTYVCVDEPEPLVCVPDIAPGEVEETCDHVDNDCDNVIDNDPMDIGGVCSTDLDGMCAIGTFGCIDDPETPRVCIPDFEPDEVEEFCNNQDDDCDGIPDNDPIEVGSVCDTGLPGICSAGVFQCVVDPITPLVCNEIILPDDESEACDDELDNDCDRFVDETNEWEWHGTAECFEPCADDTIRTCLFTGLDWYHYVVQPLTWDEANTHCGEIGWRLPTIEELETLSYLIDLETPAGNPERQTFLSAVFSGYWNRLHWASTQLDVEGTIYHYYHSFGSVTTELSYDYFRYYTYCVRETTPE